MSKTVFLIWKIRNKRRIRDQDNTTTSMEEMSRRWTNEINKRLTINQAPTDGKRFRKRALCGKLVKATWKSCLIDKELLPVDWAIKKGVLVGIACGPLRRT